MDSTRLMGLRAALLTTSLCALGCGSTPSDMMDAGERADRAAGCSADSECDDGLYCNGSERCSAGSCSSGALACGAGVACDEATDTCGAACSAPDADGDGFDATACGGDDCDDTNGAIYPGQIELCDAVDDDCNPLTYGARDADGDGSISNACCNGSTCGPDCDDSTLARRPGQLEICDSVDNDCDMSIDEAMNDVPWYPDTDGDLFGDGGGTVVVSCVPVPGASLLGTDCDDTRASVSPVAAETCNLRDDNCDGVVDEGCPGVDGGMPVDGGMMLMTCDLPMSLDESSVEFTMNAVGGCRLVREDSAMALPVRVAASFITTFPRPDGSMSPAAPLLSARGVLSATPSRVTGLRDVYELDYDTDVRVELQVGSGAAYDYVAFTLRWSRPNSVTVSAFTRAACASRMGPEVTDRCDGINSDCDAMTDEGAMLSYWTVDADGDGVGSGAPTMVSCSTVIAGSGIRFLGGDCDDFDPTRSPYAPEICDGIDNDCNTTVDDGPSVAASCAQPFSTTACVAGACVLTGCTAPYRDCDMSAGNGCEANTETSALHCGGCGMPCSDECSATGCRVTPIAHVSAGTAMPYFACTLRESGRVQCWGNNSFGQLGDGTTTSSATPVSVLGVTNAIAIESGNGAACALLATGRVVCWGNAEDLPPVPGGDASRPVEVTGITDAVEISLDLGVFCARRATGAVLCSSSGLGFGGLMALPGVTDAVSVATGAAHVCVARSGGTVLCLGDNSVGQLGDGTTVSRTTLRTVMGLTDAVEVSAHNGTTCARRSGGSLVCWGLNNAGQLGNASMVNSSLPVAVMGLSGVTQFSVGVLHVCALVGTAMHCWGENAGQFGTGAPIGLQTTPIAVPGVGAVTEVSAAYEANCVLSGGVVTCYLPELT